MEETSEHLLPFHQWPSSSTLDISLAMPADNPDSGAFSTWTYSYAPVNLCHCSSPLGPATNSIGRSACIARLDRSGSTYSAMLSVAFGEEEGDVNEKSHFETLTDAKSLEANLRIMASISGHNEAADAAAALTTMHRLDWTTIKQETMESQPVDCDKLERHYDDERFVGTSNTIATYDADNYPPNQQTPNTAECELESGDYVISRSIALSSGQRTSCASNNR